MAVVLVESSLTSWSTVDFQKVKGMREDFSRVEQSWDHPAPPLLHLCTSTTHTLCSSTPHHSAPSLTYTPVAPHLVLVQVVFLPEHQQALQVLQQGLAGPVAIGVLAVVEEAEDHVGELPLARRQHQDHLQVFRGSGGQGVRGQGV